MYLYTYTYTYMYVYRFIGKTLYASEILVPTTALFN